MVIDKIAVIGKKNPSFTMLLYSSVFPDISDDDYIIQRPPQVASLALT